MAELNLAEETKYYQAGRAAYYAGKKITNVPVPECCDRIHCEEYKNPANRAWFRGFNDAMMDKFQPTDTD